MKQKAVWLILLASQTKELANATSFHCSVGTVYRNVALPLCLEVPDLLDSWCSTRFLFTSHHLTHLIQTAEEEILQLQLSLQLKSFICRKYAM